LGGVCGSPDGDAAGKVGVCMHVVLLCEFLYREELVAIAELSDEGLEFLDDFGDGMKVFKLFWIMIPKRGPCSLWSSVVGPMVSWILAS
jgi:hypothetical protein